MIAPYGKTRFLYQCRLSSSAPFWQTSRLSPKPVRQQLAAKIQNALAPVHRRDLYIDTVQIWFPHGFRGIGQIKVLNSPGAVIVQRVQKLGGLMVRLHQPKLGALLFTHQNCSSYKIVRVDLALDLSVSTQTEAADLSRFLAAHLRQKWHGKRRMNVVETTMYASASAWKNRNFAIYGSKPSKVSGHPCAHLEMRFTRAKTCRNLGLHELPDLWCWNAGATIQKEVCFSALVPTKVAKVARRLASATVKVRNKRAGRKGKATTVSAAERELAVIIARYLELSVPVMEHAPIQLWCEVWPPSNIAVDASVAPLINICTTPNVF